MKIDPKDIAALINKGWVYGKLEEYKKEIDCYDQTLKIDPKKITALINMGVAYSYLEEY